MINEYGRRITVWGDTGYRPATPAEVEEVTLADPNRKASCSHGHLMHEGNIYRATIGGYVRHFCRLCKTIRKAGDQMMARERAVDESNPTCEQGHSLRTDSETIRWHRGAPICSLCTTKRSVARRRALIVWLRTVNDMKSNRYVSPHQLKSVIERHEQQIASDEEFIRRLEAMLGVEGNNPERVAA